MKNVFYGLLILSAVSCKGVSSSADKKCTFNDEPVSCDTMESTTSDSREAVKLSARSKTTIAVEGSVLSILENSYDEAKESKNGSEFTCATDTQAGDELVFKVSGNTLKLGKDGEFEEYKRIGGSGSGLIGTWQNSERDEMGMDISTLIFTEETMEIKHECHFDA